MGADIVAWNKLSDPSLMSFAAKMLYKTKSLETQFGSSSYRPSLKPAKSQLFSKYRSSTRTVTNYATSTQIAPYNNFIKTNFPDETSALFPNGVLFGGMDIDQKIAFGLYIQNGRQLHFN